MEYESAERLPNVALGKAVYIYLRQAVETMEGRWKLSEDQMITPEFVLKHPFIESMGIATDNNQVRLILEFRKDVPDNVHLFSNVPNSKVRPRYISMESIGITDAGSVLRLGRSAVTPTARELTEFWAYQQEHKIGEAAIALANPDRTTREIGWLDKVMDAVMAVSTQYPDAFTDFKRYLQQTMADEAYS